MVICSWICLSVWSTLEDTLAVMAKTWVCLNEISQNKHAVLCRTFTQKLNTSRSKSALTELGYRKGGVFRNTSKKTLKLSDESLN